MRILVVEDERKIAGILVSALETEHYEVVVAPTGEDGFFRANAEAFDLVLLDLMLPGRNGLEILRALRQRHVDTPVLILTARDGIDDRVLGLDLGADDYLVKPFAIPELLARVRALTRRGRSSEVFRLKAADLEIDLGRAPGEPRRSIAGPHGPRVRAAGVPAAPSGTPGVARDAGARSVERAAPRDADRQRD